MSQQFDSLQKFDSFQALIDSITPEILGNLKSAVETGRWPNGDRLTPHQVEHSLQAIIAYEARYMSEEQRTGYIDKTGLKKSECDAPESSRASSLLQDQQSSCRSELAREDSIIATTKPHTTH